LNRIPLVCCATAHPGAGVALFNRQVDPSLGKEDDDDRAGQ